MGDACIMATTVHGQDRPFSFEDT